MSILTKIAELEKRLESEKIDLKDRFKKKQWNKLDGASELDESAKTAEIGPRGGEIIGYTKSNKPIYKSHDHPAHKDFTSEDHNDAANTHSNKAVEAEQKRRKRFMELAKESKKAGDTLKLEAKDPETQKHKKDYAHHQEQISHHFWKSEGNPGPGGKSAEIGPRGGKIIGYTKSNKPIYESHDHPSHKDYSAKDHADASKLHWDFKDDLQSLLKKNPTISGDLRSKMLDKIDHHNAQGNNHFYSVPEKEDAAIRGKNAEIGPRGGKIIGKTSTGKPIYESKDHDEHKGFNDRETKDMHRVHDDHKQAHDTGALAGKAARGQDWGTVNHHKGWFSKFKNISSLMGADKHSLQKAYDDGYKKHSNPHPSL